ncbi:MD-2-related lipid-recognition domain [Arabidopsis thaliana x Arabidopsis arenosa]|uniref:MD-2-related lipid-recognition domain n=1 Tax=Arabidopsis thaliana x Arabidopsis arenosa TaxID=1240361 RepID=A0A8T2A5G8_9BRAS|nr:MD-2-related lipid-recognition domain [Arabidopsis thaliana x Arabidopsis arenosa]
MRGQCLITVRHEFEIGGKTLCLFSYKKLEASVSPTQEAAINLLLVCRELIGGLLEIKLLLKKKMVMWLLSHYLASPQHAISIIVFPFDCLPIDRLILRSSFRDATIDYSYGIMNVTRVEISPYPVGPYDEPTITISGFSSDDSDIIFRATIHVLYKYENATRTIINYNLYDVRDKDSYVIEPGEKFMLTLSKVPGLQSLPHKDKSKIFVSLVHVYGDKAGTLQLKFCVEFDNPAPTTTSGELYDPFDAEIELGPLGAHCVLATALGTLDDVFVLECQDSRGPTWGYSGYIYVAMHMVPGFFVIRPESPSYDEKRSSLDDCTRPNDIAGPHYRSTCTIQSLQRLKELCRLPPEVMAESKLADPTESPEDHRDGYFCVYEVYFKGCGLTFPLPEALVRYLAALEIALPQLTPNLLRTILGIITVAAEAGYIIGVPELNELLSVRSSSKKTGYFSAYPNANRNIISHLPNKDENWHHPWFLIKKTPASIGNLSDVLPSKWSAKPAFIAPTLPTEEFIGFFKIILEGETLWNSFTFDRFIEANRKLRMSPPDQLHRLPPPPSTQGMSARALTAQRKMLSKPIVEACDENKALLATAVDKKDYSRTLLVDDGTAEGARSTGAFRLTPRRERRGDRSPRRARSPCRDSPRPPRDDFSSEPLKNLICRKRDKSSRSDSSPQREKSRARTDRSPRSSPPTEPMGPPPPVDMSSQHSGEKTARSVSPLKEGSGSRDAPSKSKPVLVPQVKSLSAMEKEGSVFRCFKTRTGAILPDFDKWRPAIRERYLLHAHHSSRIDSWKSKLTTLETDLHSSSGSKQQLEDQVDSLKSELEKIKGELKDQYDQNYQLQSELSGVQGRLHESESAADTLNNQLIELNAKYKAITKLRDSELAKSASKARKEVKGRGMELIQGGIRFIQTEKVKSDLESDIKEHESNLILLDQIHEKDFFEVKERSELTANLSEKQSCLAALPASSFNPQHFEEFFTESPPISSSGTEGVVPSEVPAAPEVTLGDDCTAGNEQGASSDQAPAKEAGENPTTEVESEVVVDPPLFLSGDGFEPAGVLFPHAVFHFPSREKKEAYDFMDKIVDKHRRLCDERQRLGLKSQTLEARIARVERKVRALESDPFQWEWRNFDSIAEIPRMLRMYLRAKGQVQGPVNAPTKVAPLDSEEEDGEDDDKPCKRVRNEPGVEGRNDASTSNSKPAMKEPVPEPLP